MKQKWKCARSMRRREIISCPLRVYLTQYVQWERYILGGNMPKSSYQLKDAYLSLFQPDPMLQDYGPPPPKLNNSRLGPLASCVHAPIGNCIANVIIFNSTQYATLQPMLSNMDSNYKIVYILPTQLPEVDAEPSKCWVSIPTVALPDNAPKIASPVPYAMFT